MIGNIFAFFFICVAISIFIVSIIERRKLNENPDHKESTKRKKKAGDYVYNNLTIQRFGKRR